MMALNAPSREALTLLRHSIRSSIVLRPQAHRLIPSVPRSSLHSCLRSSISRSSIRTVVSYTHSHHADAVSTIPSAVDKNSEDFKENKKQMDEAIEHLTELHTKIAQGGPEKARETRKIV